MLVKLFQNAKFTMLSSIPNKKPAMKNMIAKISISLMLICSFALVNAQVASAAPAKSADEQLREKQIAKANDITAHIAADTKITDEQKTRLQATMLEAVIAHHNAVLKAKKQGDETNLSSLNQEFVNDITARMKTILTAEQFDAAMAEEKGK
jgi:hypothetical protein